MPVVASAAASPQQGFIAKRHFTNKVLLVDTVSRIYSNLFSKYGTALAAFFDFANAFPSLAIQFIFLVIDCLGMPQGLQNFIRALYHNVYAFLKHADQVEYLCIVRCGVLQGCPLAALLFVLSLEPFVLMFKARIDDCGRGLTTICADDIALVVKNIYELIVAHIIFIKGEWAAGLKLKISKCILVPLSGPLSPALVQSIKSFLHTHIPAWANFVVASSAEYLGIWTGPTASVKHWTTQIAKYRDRVCAISDAAPPTALGIRTYNVKTVPVLSYPAQFLPPLG